MAQIPYSRVPIYEGNSANLIGTVWIYDVCFGAEQGLKDYVRPVRTMKAEMPIDAALLTLRNNHEPMAFVEDRRGRVLGIVTLKDLVTEIVTDLHDL
jgi:CBS domain containing-hemolysin-like protein